MRRTAMTALLLSASFSWACATTQPAPPADAPQAQARVPVQSVGDLPRRAYPVQGSVSALIQDDAAFADFAGKLRRDLEEELARYDIQDVSALQERYGTLAQLQALEGRYDRAIELVDQAQALEDKPALRLMYGQQLRAMAKAHADTGAAPGDPAFGERFQVHLAEALRALPWEVVQDVVQQTKGSLEIQSENLILGMAQSRLDPVVAKTGEISGDLAPAVVGLRYALEYAQPLQADAHAVYAALVEEHAEAKADIWPGRALTLDASDGLDPVVVAVWDTGVDTTLFPGKVFVNEGETVNGRDDDGDGFVDDVHGIAFGLDGRYSTELLYPPGEQQERLPGAMQHLKGLTDLQAAVDSPEATALRQLMASMSPEEMGPFFESLGFAGAYAHGTHVAGILEEGNPFARILVARISFDHRMVPAPFTEEIMRRHADSYRQTAAFFRENGVRVVNMSWGWSLKEIEQNLEVNGLGGTAEARGKEASRLLGILREGMREAIAGSPDILFVAAAGNADDDPAFAESLPASLAPLPNLVMVGALDQAGERTGFTSGGKDVRLYANGFEVESYVPGGARMAFSGTSMSSPNVANLAAKLVALKPQLKPTEVVALMEQGADALPSDPELKRINPKRSAELLAQ